MNADIPYISGFWPDLLFAILMLVNGIMCAWCPKWWTTFRDNRKKKICKRCGIAMIVIGIALLIMDFV
jgi:hypothetical protein